jgi:hypothetical protein
MLITSRTISRGHATNSTSSATTGSMNAAVFLKKGDVARIIGSSVNARIHINMDVNISFSEGRGRAAETLQGCG